MQRSMLNTISAQVKKNHFCSKHDLFEGEHSTAMLWRETQLNQLGGNQPVAVRKVTPVQAAQPTGALSPHMLLVPHQECLWPLPLHRGAQAHCLPPAARLATTAASAQGSGKGAGEVCWCGTVACERQQFLFGSWSGDKAGSQAHVVDEASVQEAATTQSNPHLLWHSFGLSLHVLREKSYHFLVDVEIPFSTLFQGVPATSLEHHGSSPNSFSSVPPRCCLHLCGPSKSQSKNRLESFLWQVSIRVWMKQKSHPNLKQRAQSSTRQCRALGSAQALCHTTSLLCQAQGQSRASLQGISWKCGHVPYTAGLLRHWIGLWGASSSLEGPGRGKCSDAAREERPAGTMSRVKRPGAPSRSRPCLLPLHTPRERLLGFFLLLFPLLAVLPPSSNEGVGDWLTAHFPAQQVMHAFDKGCSQVFFF